MPCLKTTQIVQLLILGTILIIFCLSVAFVAFQPEIPDNKICEDPKLTAAKVINNNSGNQYIYQRCVISYSFEERKYGMGNHILYMMGLYFELGPKIFDCCKMFPLGFKFFRTNANFSTDLEIFADELLDIGSSRVIATRAEVAPILWKQQSQKRHENLHHPGKKMGRETKEGTEIITIPQIDSKNVVKKPTTKINSKTFNELKYDISQLKTEIYYVTDNEDHFRRTYHKNLITWHFFGNTLHYSPYVSFIQTHIKFAHDIHQLFVRHIQREYLDETLSVHIRDGDWQNHCEHTLVNDFGGSWFDTFYACYPDTNLIINNINRVLAEQEGAIKYLILVTVHHRKKKVEAIKAYYEIAIPDLVIYTVPEIFPVVGEYSGFVQDALDILLLSKTKAFLGNYFSSFSMIAALNRNDNRYYFTYYGYDYGNWGMSILSLRLLVFLSMIVFISIVILSKKENGLSSLLYEWIKKVFQSKLNMLLCICTLFGTFLALWLVPYIILGLFVVIQIPFLLKYL